MDNIQDVSSQLMKPPKELATWSFPLAQILEKYFELLPEPCKIQYGEAALVIQNSVNAYARRVEELYDETKCLNLKVLVESDDGEKQKAQKTGRSGKPAIDFNEFDLIKSIDKIGTNINSKKGDKRKIPLLHRCFPQLENLHTKLSIDVFDISEEVIGKKYDFRCNQRMSKYGTLVEEFNCKDFECYVAPENPPSIQSEQSQTDTTNHNLSNSTRASTNDNDSCVEPDIDSETSIHNDTTGTNESIAPSQTESMGGETTETSVHNETVETNDESSSQPNEESVVDDIPDSIDNECIIDDDDHHHGADSPTVDIEESNPPVGEARGVSSPPALEQESLNEETQENNGVNLQSHQTESQNVAALKKTDEVVNNKGDEVGGSGRNESITTRTRSKMLSKDSVSNSRDSDSVLEPIPFQDGIPDKAAKPRKEFKLPCHISLLTRNPRKSKCSRSTNSKSKKSKSDPQPAESCPNDFVPDVTRENTPVDEDFLNIQSEKMTMYSPTRPHPGMLEEPHADIGRHIRQPFIVNYEPVTTLNMDLLGFQIHSVEDNTRIKTSPETSFINSEFTPSRSSSPLSTTDFLPPVSASQDVASRTAHRGQSARKRLRLGHDFNDLVRHKIKKICDELDVQTVEDQKVAKWHEEIKPRLMEAERKPPFHMHEYQSRIVSKLKLYDRKLKFDDIVCQEPTAEIARYFSATLQLASTHNLDINSSKSDEDSIELILLD
ncbi:hypothetical protein QAD02_009982 [Eretmocerus hayati]|uniref:Uncharacterized protein n=1 Tax=Eretmocerus hayati TaxID=131215 RepID=A0ACC2NAT6_9HYME|nr:hypothetical protein QAD02_009982 [Eretmocerus hayati]